VYFIYERDIVFFKVEVVLFRLVFKQVLLVYNLAQRPSRVEILVFEKQRKTLILKITFMIFRMASKERMKLCRVVWSIESQVGLINRHVLVLRILSFDIL
jgi:hypothetical protein